MAKRRRRSRRYARNPVSIRRALSNPMGVVKPAVVGAAGALAVNGIVNYVPFIPDSFKVGNALHLTKAALALILGTIGPKLPIVGRHAGKMAEGALTVVMADVGKQLAMNAGYNLSGTGFVNPARVMNGNGNGGGNVRQIGQYVRGPGVAGVRGSMRQYVR